MSRKKKKADADKRPTPGLRRRRAFKTSIAAGLTLLCVAAGAGSVWWTPVRPDPVAAVVPARQQGNLALSKEYIYAGGRLVATEEPQPAGPPPSGLLATTVAATASAVSVEVNWSAPDSCAGCVYLVERQGDGGAVTTVSPQNHTATSCTDTGALPDKAYLYYVRAVYPSGGVSTRSEPDLATTVVFSEPLAATVTTIKAVHLTELRRAVNAVRTLAGGGLGPASWRYPDPVSIPPEQRRGIYLEDVMELRARLDEALNVLDLPTTYPAEPALERGAVVRAAHFEQIRERVR